MRDSASRVVTIAIATSPGWFRSIETALAAAGGAHSVAHFYGFATIEIVRRRDGAAHVENCEYESRARGLDTLLDRDARCNAPLRICRAAAPTGALPCVLTRCSTCAACACPLRCASRCCWSAPFSPSEPRSACTTIARRRASFRTP